jgi:NAD(P)-dependent dehydrogenase (short-subunit alcohol dehydrogenase family)
MEPLADPFADRVAVVTGGAGGIGMAMARAFAARGARLVLADIDEEALALAEKELRDAGASVLGVPTDVTRRESVQALAVLGPMVDATPADWELSFAINFWGVVHGVQAFVPRMLEQGQGGHVVNTASMAGLVGMSWLGVYCASKFAVVGLSESLARELEPRGIGVSVLCPMIVATNINENSRRMVSTQARGPTAMVVPPQQEMRGGVIAPEEVAQRVVRAIEERRLYVLTHPEQRAILQRRAARLDAEFAPERWNPDA